MIIHLEDRRQQLKGLIGKIQHLCGGVPLLFIGLKKLAAGDPDWPLAALEVAVAGVVIVIFLRELRDTVRQRGQGHSVAAHSGLGWFDIAAGVLLIFEAFEGQHMKPGYQRPSFLTGIVTIALGVLHSRLEDRKQRRRYLKVDETGLEYRLSKFRRLRLAWADLESVDVAGERAAFHRKDGGRHTIRLSRLQNHAEVRQAIADHARSAGLSAPKLG